MRKFLLLFTLLTAIFTLSAETRLLNVSVYNFGEIARVSLTFNQKPIYSFRKDTTNKKIVISVPNGKSSILKEKKVQSPTIRSIYYLSDSGQLSITILTTKLFEDIKEYSQSRGNYVLSYDIFNSKTPTKLSELISYGDYFSFLGKKSNAENYYKKALKLTPNSKSINAKLNRLINKKAQSKTNEVNIENKNTTPTPIISTEKKSAETLKKDIIETQNKLSNKTENIPVNKSIIDTVNQTDTTKLLKPVSVKKTLMRIPITKPEFIIKKSNPIKQTHPQEEKLDLEEIKTPIVNTTKAQLPVKTVTNDSLRLSINEKKLLNLFNKADNDSLKQAFILGLVSRYSEVTNEAIQYFKSIPDSHQLKKEANIQLFQIYTNTGQINEAKMLASFSQSDTTKIDRTTSLLKTKIEVWMGLTFGVLILILTIIGMSMFQHWKLLKNKPKISDEEFEIHKNNLKRAYENREKYQQEEQEEVENHPDSNSSLIPDYDNPPVIAEDLDHEEESQLIKEEEDRDRYITIMKKDKPSDNDFQEGFDGFGDEEYKKKMILKLYNDGWAIEEIAKELQISQREIDFIIKMSE